jgi:hypothetical protein
MLSIKAWMVKAKINENKRRRRRRRIKIRKKMKKMSIIRWDSSLLMAMLLMLLINM